MQEQNKSMLDYTMHFGAILGVFWIIKYMFFIGENYWVHFIYFYYLLSIVSPLLMYIFYLRYRMIDPEGTQGLGKCMLFVMGICFFGSLFESVIIYAHYAFINPEYFAKISAPFIGVLDKTPNLGNIPEAEFQQSKLLAESIMSNKFTYLIANIMNQVFVGFILSILIGLLAGRKNPNSNAN